jgi:DNA (cytosine-5)-methyltransferase 1
MKALSIFSGCGGLDIGVENAGFENIASIEIDKFAAASLRNWHKKKGHSTVVYEDDIRNIDPKIFTNKDVQLLHGGPPCQAFSLIGKRNSLEDPRGQLLFEVIRFAKTILPQAILVEQVKGLLSAKDSEGVKGGAFKLFLEELEKLGYVPKWQVINAADYGIPQRRERLFVVATLGRNGFQFPFPTHSEEQEDLTFFPLKPYETVGDYLLDLPKPTLKGLKEKFPNHSDVTPARDKERISYVPEGSHLAAQTHAPADIIMRLTKKDTTKFKRTSTKDPSLTLRGGEIFFHPVEDRYLTPREYLRIHTYPDEYILEGPVRGRSGTVKNLDQHRQVANSVPPKLAQILANQIKKIL